jgi:hypothetical protein
LLFADGVAVGLPCQKFKSEYSQMTTSKSKSKFVPQKLGLTAFMAANRIDFVIDGPALKTPERCSAFYNAPEAKLKIAGKSLKIGSVITDPESGEPTAIEVKFGREVLRMGRRKEAKGDVSFYRSLEPSNKVAGPKTAAEILAALEAFNS